MAVRVSFLSVVLYEYKISYILALFFLKIKNAYFLFDKYIKAISFL